MIDNELECVSEWKVVFDVRSRLPCLEAVQES